MNMISNGNMYKHFKMHYQSFDLRIYTLTVWYDCVFFVLLQN